MPKAGELTVELYNDFCLTYGKLKQDLRIDADFREIAIQPELLHTYTCKFLLQCSGQRPFAAVALQKGSGAQGRDHREAVRAQNNR